MTRTPKWLPDGSGIDPDSLDVGMIAETAGGSRAVVDHDGPAIPWQRTPIVRVYADVTPPRPDLRVEVLAKVLHDEGGCCDPFGTCVSTSEHYRDVARDVLAALDAMGADQ